MGSREVTVTEGWGENGFDPKVKSFMVNVSGLLPNSTTLSCIPSPPPPAPLPLSFLFSRPQEEMTKVHWCKGLIIRLFYIFLMPAVKPSLMRRLIGQSSRTVWKLRWPSWAPIPNKPMVSVDVKQHFNNKGSLAWDLNSGCKRHTLMPKLAVTSRWWWWWWVDA